MKAFLLMSNVEDSDDGYARKWISGQPSEIKTSFAKLVAALKL